MTIFANQSVTDVNWCAAASVCRIAPITVFRGFLSGPVWLEIMALMMSLMLNWGLGIRWTLQVDIDIPDQLLMEVRCSSRALSEFSVQVGMGLNRPAIQGGL